MRTLYRCNKFHEPPHIALDACFLQRIHILISLLDGYDDPVITAGGKHGVHQESAEAAVAVHAGVDEGE